MVVPVYNVEQYVAECLDSILGQSFADLEIVVVDDGSTDRSAEIVRGYAQRFGNVRVVTTTNHGLGAARNIGVQHASGELLAFADSDDLVPDGAYAAMVSTLDESGSDLVVGAMKRHNRAGRSTMPPRQKLLHERRRLAVTADDFPEILSDVFAWNKVYRRDFWDRAGMAFPEGVRYEDQPATTRAYLQARAFDVIRKPVYLWRVRDDRTSITQTRHDPRHALEDLRDRLSTKRDSLATVQRLGSPKVLRAFYRDGLILGFPNRFRRIPECDDRYWRMLHVGLRDLWTEGPSFAETRLPVEHRVVAWLVLNGRRAEAEQVVLYAERHLPDLPVREHGDDLVVTLPFWDEPSAGVPRELYVLREHERADHAHRVAGAAASGSGEQ